MILGNLWTAPWTWKPSMGVGIKLTGIPRDLDEFRTYVYGMSCNPVAAERIIRELREYGVKLTTLQSSFNFGQMADEFARMGVKMEVIPPVEKPFNSIIDYAALCIIKEQALPKGLTAEETREAYRRAADTPNLDLEHLGPYA